MIESGRLNRRLATILCADLVGYSRLMEADEEATHLRVRQLSGDVLEPAIRTHQGRLVKKTGDGLLAQFESVLHAAECAIGIQREIAARNEPLPRDQRLSYRIGINIGDVLIEPDDIYGDGVNVAVRLEALAKPGGIVVSRAVRDSVMNQLQLRFVDLGDVRVKNIARPIHAFAIDIDTPEGLRGRTESRKRWWPAPGWYHSRVGGLICLGLGLAALGGLETRQYVTGFAGRIPFLLKDAAISVPPDGISIAVVPFSNLGAEAQEDYFVDGITDSLITDLSRALPGAFIVSRGTSFRFKSQPIEPTRVGRELNVRYLLEGSVTPEKEMIRVNARLVDATTGRELWGDRFDSRREEVLKLQNQIVARLSRAIGLNLVEIEARLARVRAKNPSAVDLVMRAQAIANRPASRDTMVAARGLFEQALAIDANCADAMAGIATTYVFEVLNSYYHEGREKRLLDAEALIQKTLDIDPDHVVAHKTRAAILRANGRFEDAIAASLAVIAQNPGEPWAYKEVGLSHLYLGRFREALSWFEKADRIGPHDPSRWIWLGAMGRVQFFLGNTREAVRLLRLSADANPKDPRAYALLAAVFASTGQREESARALANAIRLQPEMTISRLFDDWSVPLAATDPLYREQHGRFRTGLQAAGMRD